MYTIPKNRVADFLPKITEVKSYTLENHFRGKPVADLQHWAEWTIRLGGKVQIDKTLKIGRVRHHSNHWDEFKFV